MLLLLSGIVSTILSLLWAEAMYKSKVHSYVCSDKGVNCSDFMLWIWSLYSWGCSLMLLYSWIVPSESFFHTAVPQRNERFQYFMSCCCFLFLCFCLFVLFHQEQKPQMYKSICMLLYGQMYNLISVSKN